jgi:hypothetical protein
VKRTDAYVKTKDLNMALKHVTRLVVDRARQAGWNPRKGIITIYMEDDGVGAKWVQEEDK